MIRIRAGDRVQVMDGSGLDSRRRGTVVSVYPRRRNAKIGGLHTMNGAVATIRPEEGGALFSMFVAHLIHLEAQP